MKTRLTRFLLLTFVIAFILTPISFGQGNALNFDGSNDYVVLNSSLSIANSSFTLECWVKFPGGTAPYFQQLTLISIGSTPGGSYLDAGFHYTRPVNDFMIGYLPGTMTYYFYGNDHYYTYNTDGAWHHFAYTFNKDNLSAKLYIDGAMVASATKNQVMTGSGRAVLGATAWDFGNKLMGSMDEVRIWNVERTAEEINNNKSNTSLSTSSTGLLAYYKFDQGTAGENNAGITTLFDATSNSYNGTLTNFALTGTTSNWISNDGPLPVELVSFNATKLSSNTLLSWSTATEVNNYGFEVERSSNANSWELVGFVSGAGNSNSTKEYSFTDTKPLSGKNYYRLKQIDTDGSFEYSSLVEADFGSPVSYSLNQNYPNPFNPSTYISFSLPVQENVTLKVYDLLGTEVATLIDGLVDAGNHNIELSATNLASGFYLYKLETPGFSSVKKMQLVK